MYGEKSLRNLRHAFVCVRGQLKTSRVTNSTEVATGLMTGIESAPKREGERISFGLEGAEWPKSGLETIKRGHQVNYFNESNGVSSRYTTAKWGERRRKESRKKEGIKRQTV